ncbi:MAG: lytic transglycosylase domain-containing protein [Rhodopila sp.]
MTWRPLPILLALLAPCQARADLSLTMQTPATALCRQAITAAERVHGIPAHLLAAIARVESGRRDQDSGTFNPWPWTINMDGQGSFHDTKAQAVAAAQAMRPRVTRSIDVGCMQISLTHHPDAFRDLTQAFDPAANADYGARFLAQLHDRTGSWPEAVAQYHSATPDIGQEYQRKVYAAWPEEQRLAFATTPAPTLRPWVGFYSSYTPPAGPRPQTARIIPLPSATGGITAPGRTLEMYRAMPVRIASPRR